MRFYIGKDINNKTYWYLRYRGLDIIAYCQYCFHSDIDILNSLLGR